MSSKLTAKGERDLKLIRLALENGDTTAYNELLKLYRDPLYFMLYEKVNDKELAKDLTIESLGKAFNKLHLYTPIYTFSTWLFTVARNHCIDYLRKNKLSTISIDKIILNSEGKATNLDLKSSDLNPEQKLERKQRIAMLRQVVDSLKPNYRTLVKLRYFKEMTYDEIAKKLDIPIGTVKAQLHRSREQLFKIMSGLRQSI
ncbi:sigma-70 family RNA polymerase sigma factor [Flavobacteriales bacterium]|jgi:RNA polymerase sigma-70 factor (ECF subfamily)|nr:sigma-70 family RNA polymerase sigma factor [Flavobacteriales bacterium]MDC3390069.1 sigma-70 family RNA polymerase sigma factor [Flavobacteriales bacterium]|tara:strand:+ start:744 stop:1346 length:603 start_codon:yes stop_codon:yes gene_type:complete